MEEVSAQSDGGGEGTVRRKRQTLLATGATCCAMIGEGGYWGSRRREEGTSEMSPRFLGRAVWERRGIIPVLQP